MENYLNSDSKPRYTRSWLGLHCLFALISALFLACAALFVEFYASSRVKDGLLGDSSYRLLSDSVGYCFWLIAISTISIMLIELTFRKSISYIQYTLTSFALTLFYLLLLAMSEHLRFSFSYAIVSVMTIGLISLFVKGIIQKGKAVAMTVAILATEYAVMFLLIRMGSLALLLGSLMLFALIACAMYLTLRLRMENNEIVIK